MENKYGLTEEHAEHLKWMQNIYGREVFRIVQMTTLTEQMVNFCIADLITKDRKCAKVMIKYLIMDHKLTSKIRLLTKILKENHPELHKKYKPYFKRLTKLCEYRNELVHGNLNSSPEIIMKLDKTQIPYENSPKVEGTLYLNLKDCNSKIDEMLEINKTIAELAAYIKTIPDTQE